MTCTHVVLLQYLTFKVLLHTLVEYMNDTLIVFCMCMTLAALLQLLVLIIIIIIMVIVMGSRLVFIRGKNVIFYVLSMFYFMRREFLCR